MGQVKVTDEFTDSYDPNTDEGCMIPEERETFRLH